jgi:hypothetical protein
MIFSPVAAGLGDWVAAADGELDPPQATRTAPAASDEATTFNFMKADTGVGYEAVTPA